MNRKQYLGAHWATNEEIKNLELLQSKGFLLGTLNNQKILDSSYKNLLLFAPTGTGKGVAFVVPNLLSWEESIIVHDIKCENFELTSGYRETFLKQKIFLWNPSTKNGKTHCYNPLDCILNPALNSIEEAKKIVEILLPKQEFLQNEAKSLILSLILSLNLEKNRPNTLGEIYRILKTEDLNIYLASLQNNYKDILNPVALLNIPYYLNKDKEEKAKIKYIAAEALELWADPYIDEATSKSDFDVASFNKKAQTLYVGIEPKDIKRLQPLMQIFYQQCVALITIGNLDRKSKIGTVLLLDEFPTLGKINLPQMLPYTRGYKLKVALIVQNIDQLKNVYGESETEQILSNCVKITYANNRNTAEVFSKLIGEEILINEDGSKTPKPLFLPQEIVSLEKLEEIIILYDSGAIKCNKFFYYTDPEYTKRLLKESKIK